MKMYNLLWRIVLAVGALRARLPRKEYLPEKGKLLLNVQTRNFSFFAKVVKSKRRSMHALDQRISSSLT